MTKLFVCTALVLFLAAPHMACAGYEEGYRAANAGSYETAFKEFKKAAESGDVSAQYSLAVMYNDGIGVRKNPGEAMIWFRKAAAKGHPLAIEILKRKNK